MGRIDDLLAADEANTRLAPKLIANLDRWALQAFDDTASLYRLLYRVLGDWPTEHRVDENLHRIAEANGLTAQQLIERLYAGTANDIEGAVEQWSRLWTLRVVKYLVLACQRYWAFGAADLYRFRQTSALGYLRLAAESMATFSLLVGDDSLAERWSHLTGKEEGKRLFRETQPRIREVLRTFDLEDTYDLASSSAQHVRMAGLVRSMATQSGPSLRDQEFDPEDSYSYHLGVAHFHRVQSRILAALGSVIPDARTEEWVREEAAFRANVDRLWAILGKRYAEQIREHQTEGSG